MCLCIIHFVSGLFDADILYLILFFTIEQCKMEHMNVQATIINL